jgi:hypothetical protein
LSLAVVAPAACVAADRSPLEIAYSADAKLCEGLHQLLSGYHYFCPLTDDHCFNSSWGDEDSLGLTRVPFQQVAVNQYGYTEVYVAKPPDKSYSLVYLYGFQGDHNPALLETWKVDSVALNSLLALDPHPLPYDEWVKGGHGITRETLAGEFAQFLARSEKLSDDWAPMRMMPVISAAGVDYAVSRECAGDWGFGGEYHCAAITKVIVKRISEGQKALPICEFSSKRRKRN